MKILMLAPTPYFSDRGCHVRIYEEARALQALGNEVHICTYHLGADTEGIAVHRICRVPWYGKLSAGPSWHKTYLDILLLLKALKVAWKIRPHIVHAHLHEGAFIGCFLKKILRVPMVFDCQGSLCGELLEHRFIREGGRLHRFFHRLERWIGRTADYVVASSEPMARLLVSRFGLAKEKVSILADGVDPVRFRPAAADATLCRRLGIPAGRRVVVYLGSMGAGQGVELLLEAIRLVEQKTTSLHFLLMGYPEAEHRRRVEAMGLSHLVSFTGRISYFEAATYLSAGEVALSPKLSQTEANGKLLNYMACGLPTVVFDTAVNRQILGESGIYAAAANAADLAEKLLSLAQVEVPRLHDMGWKLRRRAETAFAWSERGAELMGIYRSLLRERQGQR